MKRTLAMVTAILMASASAPAFAEDTMKNNSSSGAQLDTGVGTELNADAEAGVGSTLELDTGTTASTGGSANFGSVISSIRSGSMNTADIEALEDASNVSIVRIDSLTGAADEPEALDNALNDNQPQIDELRASLSTELEANTELQAMFEQESVTAQDVVAAESGADGSMTIYVR